MDSSSLKVRGGNRSLTPIYEEKPHHRPRSRQQQKKESAGDETEATASETEFDDFDEEDYPCGSSVEEEDYNDCNNAAVGDDETHPYDECTMFEEYTIEEYTIDGDGYGNMTCGDDYTFVTIHEEEEKMVLFFVSFSRKK